MSTATLEQTAVQTPVASVEPVSTEPTVKPVEGQTTEQPTETKPVEKPAEEQESSTIRDMRRALKRKDAEMRELRQMVESAIPKPQAPTQEQFPDVGSFIDARIAYNQQQYQAPMANPLAEKMAEATKAHADFSEKIHDIDHVDFKKNGQALTEAMQTLQYGSDVLYHLASNPEVAEEIAILPPAAFAARLGEIHADIRREKNAPKKASNAPAPVKPVGGNASVQPDPSKMTDKEWLDARREKRKQEMLKRMGR
jgi:hypothetical protein